MICYRLQAEDRFETNLRKFYLTHSVPVLPHIETSQLICTANQLTSFYMRATLAPNGLISNL